MGRKIIIFYKQLLEVGGAERLLVKSYQAFREQGYKVEILAYRINREALFNEDVNEEDLIELRSSSGFSSFLKLISFLRKNRNAIVLCDSGHIDIYLATRLISTTYSLHLHHPLFMSFNDYDKYSYFLSDYFDKRIESNFGAQRFLDIKSRLSIRKKLFLNIRAFFSIRSIRAAQHSFVLSKYAQDEKKELFGIDSHVLCGALDQGIFDYQSPEKFVNYDRFDHVILTIGRLDINKRIDELIRAFDILVKDGLNVALIIGGKGPEYDSLNALAAKLGLKDRIIFLGFVPDELLFDYYARADIFASIDWADYRITSYESWAMGTPVLLSNEIPYDEYLQKSNYLFLTHPTHQATAVALKQALNSSPKISLPELHTYLEDFTWKTYNEAITAVLDHER